MTDNEIRERAEKEARDILPATIEFDNHPSLNAGATALLRAEARGMRLVEWQTKQDDDLFYQFHRIADEMDGGKK